MEGPGSGGPCRYSGAVVRTKAGLAAPADAVRPTASPATATTVPVAPATAVLPGRAEPPQSGLETHVVPNDLPPLELDRVRAVWPDLVKKVDAPSLAGASRIEPTALEGPDVLVIAAEAGYNSTFDECAGSLRRWRRSGKRSRG